MASERDLEKDVLKNDPQNTQSALAMSQTN